MVMLSLDSCDSGLPKREEQAISMSFRMNYIKPTIECRGKAPAEYKFHLDGDIFAVVNVYQTFRIVHIQHYRDKTNPLSGV